MATKPWDRPISSSMFGGGGSSTTFAPVQGQNFNSGPVWDQMRFDQPATPRSEFNIEKAFEAIGKSFERLGQSRGFTNSSVDRSMKGSVGNAQLVGQGRGYRMYQSEPDIYEKKEVEQRAPGRGIGSTLLGIAAPIASVIPGGQVVGAGLAAGSGALGAFGL